jgi:two-component system sensor histidine kinase DesK
MTAHATPEPLASLRYARLLLIAVHITLVAGYALMATTSWDGPPRPAEAVVPVAVALGALQLRHSLVAARGERPAGAAMTFALLSALAVVPTLWFKIQWWGTTSFVVASAAMLFRGWTRRVLCGVPLVGVSVGIGVYDWFTYDPWTGVHTGVGWAAVTLGMGGGLYAATQLIRTLDELHVLRVELADQAVAYERLRVSRDLHDLLGQSLAAVSLKGDLALALLPAEPTAARAEIDGIVAVARTALRDTRAVIDAPHAPSLSAELDGAAALLDAAKIRARIEVDLAGLGSPVEDVLAWATREGVTNVVRHSEASTCSILGWRDHGTVWLEVANDGARTTTGKGHDPGQGLAGLAERVYAVSGRLAATNSNGWFRLVVEIPESAAEP